MSNKRQPRPFDKKLSLKLDRAIVEAERGSLWGRIKKCFYEWWIWGGGR